MKAHLLVRTMEMGDVMKDDDRVPQDARVTSTSMTRRGFLKAAVAASALTTLAGSSLAVASTLDTGANQKETSEEKTYRGVCRPNCFGYCHLNVHVRDGLVVKTSKASYSDERYSRICQRGLSHAQRMYDASRMQYPMRRVEGTPRGGGQWECISWDEAFADLASHSPRRRRTTVCRRSPYIPGRAAPSCWATICMPVCGRC